MRVLRNFMVCSAVVILFLLQNCAGKESLVIHKQISGPIKTNCYLIYDPVSREGALVDPGWRIDSLLKIIDGNKVDLKYILITHGHIDHIYYIPQIKSKFPEVKLCMHKKDYTDLFTALKWIEQNYGREWIENACKDPDTKAYIEFDMNSIREPEIYVEDSQKLKLGNSEIEAIHTPGHSPGGICYHTGSSLFSGDVLFYRTAGRTDTQHGSKEDQVRSVKKLYRILPEETAVYPGHGKPTDIGTEKKYNKKIIAGN